MARKTQRSHVSEIIENNPNLLELFEILHCGIALHTPDGIYHYANKAYRNMFGMAGNEPIGRHVRDYFDTAEQGVMLAIKTKKEVMGTTAAKDGVYGVAYRIPLLNAGGDLQGVLAEVVTAGYDRKNVAELMKLIQDLQKKTYYYEWETRNQPKELHSFERIVGESIPMRKLKAMGVRFATGRQPVLIFGESGTGKELVAQALHRASERAQKPFVAVNCAALPQELIESELFGYGPGAFSGSKSGGMKGKFEQAEAGTVFLDEIGELPLHMQSKLLRVLESGEIQKLGSSGTTYVDFRLIAATNRNLEQMVADGTFREDLFHRLSVLELHIPPLRNHAEDIPHLIRCFLEEMIGFKQAHALEVSERVMGLFRNYTWPGNIRELKNLLASTLYAIEEQETIIDLQHLPERFLKRIHPRDTLDERYVPSTGSLKTILAHAERHAIREALKRSDQNRTLAARELNISRSNLYKRMAELGMRSD
ncbi:MAG: sigma-54 interaction domain-containing protein [Bilophila wadsworthia]|uniref:sigma-54 interaction domain-containing protein n=1 Tax=Bilophila wadsworthia TaxID=35833 RepID=UPI003A40335D